MGPFGKLMQHVSYRKRRAVFGGGRHDGPAAKSCRHVRCLLTAPFILLVCQRPKFPLARYLRVEVDLQSSKSSKNHQIDLGMILDDFGSPEDPQRIPRGRPDYSQRTPENLQRPFRRPTGDQQGTKWAPTGDQQGTNRAPIGDQQGTNRGPSEEHQKASRPTI